MSNERSLTCFLVCSSFQYVCQYPGMCLRPGDFPVKLSLSFRINNHNNDDNRYQNRYGSPRRSCSDLSESASPTAVGTTTTQNVTKNSNTKLVTVIHCKRRILWEIVFKLNTKRRNE